MKKPKNDRVAARLDSDLKGQVERAAAILHLPESKVVELALRVYLPPVLKGKVNPLKAA